ncbi:MAG: Glycerol-3-phosphate acyltransferase [Pseudidiomarina mangrovi]|nr:MAG: Glycerol-3-phosphate acyltransferase [Pseudidiomarina mangrovi]
MLGTLRHLKNFGDGYVTFGEPINVGEALDSLQPSWRESITIGAEEPARPKWLTPTVNLLAEQIMQRINNAAALNSINLSALALLSAEQHSLTREELISQMEVYTTILREVPYSLDSYVPEQSGAELWQLASKQDKFTIVSDSIGEVIRLEGNKAIAMTYYRNNIMHMVIVPAIVAAIAVGHGQFKQAQVVSLLQQLQPLLQDELFISHDSDSMALWVAALLQQFTEMGLIRQLSDTSYSAPARDSQCYFKLQLLARGASETLQRYSIILELLQQAQPLGRSELEQQAVALAERLSTLHGISAPEFFDKKVLTGLIATLKAQNYIDVDAQGQLIADQRVGAFSDRIDSLLEPAVLQTIRQSVQQWLASRST